MMCIEDKQFEQNCAMKAAFSKAIAEQQQKPKLPPKLPPKVINISKQPPLKSKPSTFDTKFMIPFYDEWHQYNIIKLISLAKEEKWLPIFIEKSTTTTENDLTTPIISGLLNKLHNKNFPDNIFYGEVNDSVTKQYNSKNLHWELFQKENGDWCKILFSYKSKIIDNLGNQIQYNNFILKMQKLGMNTLTLEIRNLEGETYTKKDKSQPFPGYIPIEIIES